MCFVLCCTVSCVCCRTLSIANWQLAPRWATYPLQTFLWDSQTLLPTRPAHSFTYVPSPQHNLAHKSTWLLPFPSLFFSMCIWGCVRFHILSSLFFLILQLLLLSFTLSLYLFFLSYISHFPPQNSPYAAPSHTHIIYTSNNARGFIIYTLTYWYYSIHTRLLTARSCIRFRGVHWDTQIFSFFYRHVLFKRTFLHLHSHTRAHT